MLIVLESVLQCASEAARAAGALLRSRLGMPGEIWWKAGGPVTEVDLAAGERLVDRIRRSFPSHAILTEERGAIGEGACRWIIDPLDGTVNLVRGLPWCANARSGLHGHPCKIGVTVKGRDTPHGMANSPGQADTNRGL